ncbi:MAG: hypothetical protein VW932_05925, partial [Flavobacteriaceae bacterium]
MQIKNFSGYAAITLFLGLVLQSCTPNPELYRIARSKSTEQNLGKSIGERTKDAIDDLGLKSWSEKDYEKFISEKAYIE